MEKFNIFKRHQKSTVFLGLYYFWWLLNIYFFASGSANYPASCGAANGAIVMLTLGIIVLYSIILLVFIADNKDHLRKDFLKILGLVYLPVVLLTIYLFILSVIS